MKSTKIVATFVCTLSVIIAGVTFANTTTLLCRFAPENTMKIPVGATHGGLDEPTYDAVITKVSNYYTPIVASHGGKLTIKRLWTDDTVNSDASRSGSSWIINAYGGLARYDIMTADAEMAVICHEMGHQLGGFPHFSILQGGTWAAVEGQADYFATSKCFRRLAATDDNITLMAGASIPKEVVAGCSTTFKSAAEIALCERENQAAQVLAQILWELGSTSSLPSPRTQTEPKTPPSFETPSTAVVSKTYAEHPLAQCRLDTYFNGSICNVDPTVDFSTTEGVTGACAQQLGATLGVRPVCWYKPTAN